MTRFNAVIVVTTLVAVGSPAIHAADPANATAASQAKPIVLTRGVSLRATVSHIDSKERKITLRDDQGLEKTFVATPEVRNFNQIKKGDVVELEYKAAVASMLEKVKDTNVAGQASTVERASEGAKPAMRAAHTTTIIATVLEIDTKERLLTAQGPKGGVVTVKVPANLKAFDSLKKGDKITAVMTEMLAVSVKTPEKKK